MIRTKSTQRIGVMAALAAPLLIALAGVSTNASAAPTAAPTKDDTADTAAANVNAREDYKKKLAELHKTRPDRKREGLEEAQFKYRRILGQPGFDEAMRVHSERLARLRRVGALVVAEGRSYDQRMQVLALIMRELDRHRAVVRDFESKVKTG